MQPSVRRVVCTCFLWLVACLSILRAECRKTTRTALAQGRPRGQAVSRIPGVPCVAGSAAASLPDSSLCAVPCWESSEPQL